MRMSEHLVIPEWSKSFTLHLSSCKEGKCGVPRCNLAGHLSRSYLDVSHITHVDINQIAVRQTLTLVELFGRLNIAQ